MTTQKQFISPETQITGPEGRPTREGYRFLRNIYDRLNDTTPPIFPEYTVATLPSASTYDNGVIIVSDEAGGRTLATSDATNWRRVSDGAIVS